MKKILVSSDCNGNFEFLLSKIQMLQKKNDFDFVLCVGNVFSSVPMLKKSMVIHIPIYFIDSGQIGKTLALLFPEGSQVLPNLTFLGRSGVKDIQGVKIAYLNGIENTTYPGFYGKESILYSSNYFTYDDCESLLSYQQEKVDILLTNNWPEDSQRNPPHKANNESQYVSRIVGALAPRYHFAAMEGFYYKRDQYQNRKGFSTAFISVAPILDKTQNKGKYLHALQIIPFSALSSDLEKKQNLATDPFSKYAIKNQTVTSKINISLKKNQLEGVIIEPLTTSPIVYFQKFNENTHTSQIQQFLQRWGDIKQLAVKGGCGTVVFKEQKTAKQCLEDSGKYSLYGNRIKFSLKNHNNKFTQKNCWFCPESRVFDKSLVVQFGRKIYMALDKGPIVPLHFQIVPYPHIDSFVHCQQQIKTQINKLILKIDSRLQVQSKSLVIYCHYLQLQFSKNHTVIHCVPVSSGDINRFQSLFQKRVLDEKLEFAKVNQEDVVDYVQKSNYYMIQIGRMIYIRIIKDKYFPVDFGRLTLCQIMDVQQRVNWKGCINQNITKNSMDYFKKLLSS